MDEQQAKELLAAVKKAADGMKRERAARDAAIIAAMEAGVPRQRIADAAEVDRTLLYKITP